MKYILAYDLGTSGVKGVLVTLRGEVAASATCGYPYTSPQPGWAEQDPQDYWNGVCNVTKEVLRSGAVNPQQIAGIAFGTLWKGIIPIDSEGNVLRKSILWLDSRAGEQAKRLNQHFGVSIFVGSDYWSKLFWLRENEPETVEKAAMILEVNAFLKWKATGVAAVDISNSFVRSLDPQLDAFYEKVFAFADISREKFPPVVNAGDKVGQLTEKAAAEMGLVPDIPVFGGNSDIQGVTVGAGCSKIGGVHVYFGSSGWVGFTVPHKEKSMLTHMDAARQVFLSGMRSIGLSLNWFADRFYSGESNVFQRIDQDVQSIPAGADGVFSTPWFFGEYPPQAGPDVRGCFLNLKPEHDRRHMARALMEGICYHLRQRTAYFCGQYGFPWPEEVHAVGGGACSDVWMQMLADIMGVKVLVSYAPRHAGAVGTAYAALIGLGICSDYDDAANQVPIQSVFVPQEENVSVYNCCYGVYTQLYQALKPIFQEMNGKRAKQ